MESTATRVKVENDSVPCACCRNCKGHFLSPICRRRAYWRGVTSRARSNCSSSVCAI